MENANKNVTADIDEELLDDVSGGFAPESLQSGYCSVCGKLTPNMFLEIRNSRKVCKTCLEGDSNAKGAQPHSNSGASGSW